jgi:hypothetical protein
MALRQRSFHRGPPITVAWLLKVDTFPLRVFGPPAPSGGPARGPSMPSTFSRSSYTTQIRTLAWFAFLASAVACGSERPSGPSGSVGPSDTLTAADSVRIADSLRILDSLQRADSLALPDSVPASPDTVAPPPPDVSHSGIAFGPFWLWDHSTVVDGPEPFTASINFTDVFVVLGQIGAARAMNQRLMLAMTDDSTEYYKTDGKFDLAKWKWHMDRYRTAEIQAAVAGGVADGTIIGNSVIDEPKRKVWGGSFNKAIVDEMCGYVKDIFPTLPVGVATVHWWLPTERFRVCDFIIDQYDYAQPPNGWGTPGGGKGDILSWRNQAFVQVKRDGVAIAFSMNVLDGGPELPGCPSSKTGGEGTYPKHCRMTPAQVRQFGLALATEGCAMFMWRYDEEFMSKSANVKAFKEIADAVATKAPRSCRRPA